MPDGPSKRRGWRFATDIALQPNVGFWGEERKWPGPRRKRRKLNQQLLGSLAIFSLKDWKPSRFNNANEDVKRFDLLAPRPESAPEQLAKKCQFVSKLPPRQRYGGRR